MNSEVTTRIILVRHGESRGNIENRFRGRKDYHLNDRGMKQAEELANHLGSMKVQKIFSSPLSRAAETAAPLSRKFNIDAETLENFNNISLGKWEGRLKSEISRQFPQKWKIWKTNPEKLSVEGGEMLQQVQKRSFSCLQNLVMKNQGKSFLIVSHRTVLKPLVAACLDMPEPYFWKLHFDTASYSILEYSKSRGYSLFQLNQIHHLSSLERELN